MNCPSCSRILSDDSNYFQFCGADIAEEISGDETRKSCRACGNIILEDSVYCPFWGEMLTDSAAIKSIPNHSEQFIKTGMQGKESGPCG